VLRDFLFAHAQKLKIKKKKDGIKKKGKKSREGEIYLVKPFLDGTTPNSMPSPATLSLLH